MNDRGRGNKGQKQCCGGDLQSCHGVAVGIGGCVVRYGLGDSSGVHVDRKEGGAEAGILCVHVLHKGYGADESWYVDLIEVQAPNAVVVSLDTGETVDAKFGLGLDVFPRYHRDVLLKGSEVDDRLDERHAFFQWTDVDEVGKEVGLWMC